MAPRERQDGPQPATTPRPPPPIRAAWAAHRPHRLAGACASAKAGLRPLAREEDALPARAPERRAHTCATRCLCARHERKHSHARALASDCDALKSTPNKRSAHPCARSRANTHAYRRGHKIPSVMVPQRASQATPSAVRLMFLGATSALPAIHGLPPAPLRGLLQRRPSSRVTSSE